MRFLRSAPLVCVALLAIACSSEDSDKSSRATSPDGGNANSDGGVTVVPAGCDLTKDSKDSPNCIASEVGIFVDATTGNDGNSGSKELPVKTIAGAQAKLAGRPRIYVCEGTYPESVKLTSPVSIYGGFACASWSYSGAKPKIAPTEGLAALEVVGVSSTIRIADLAFSGAPSSTAISSSVAVFVRQSKVDFGRIEAVGLDGKDGASGSTGSNYDPALLASDAKLKGKSGILKTGGGTQTCLMLCTNGIQSTGGKGGDGGNTPTDGEKGEPDRGGGVAGLKGASCVGIGAGGFGGKGNPGQDGSEAIASTSLGKLADTGWTPSDGAPGGFGGPGQGGGGGGGNIDANEGAGGGGGCGGCGGAPGGPGKGGGASIGLLVLNSVVTITDAAVSTQKAGKGGAGAPGQVGQVAGAGGAASSGGCQGGGGGNGGAGGASAGGAGGVSVGILYRGDKPTTQNVTFTIGTKGEKGAGGAAGNAGLDGVSQESLEVSL